MLRRTDSPSYGYQLAQGATALTEAWNARRGSSQDHLMLGDAEEWFYAGLGGIRVDFSRPQPEQIVITPALLPRIGSAQVDYRSVKGTIRVAWKYQPAETRLDVVIPPNASAVVKLPQPEGARILESGRPAMQSPGVSLLQRDGSSADYRVESGEYHFSIVARR
jgi:alpha-L-rhamnosidase